jgi:hypothetical protein
MAPASGPVGTTVTITGTGFAATAAQNAVYFGGMRAAVLAASATQLRVTVPSGVATASSVTVINQTDGLQGVSTTDGAGPFRVTFAGGSLGLNTFRRTDVRVGATPNYMAATADFNQDGKLDVLGINNNLSLAYGDGTGSFGAPVALAAGFQPSRAVVADFTGDGLLDIVTVNTGSEDVSLLVGLGAAGFASAQTIYTNSNASQSLGSQVLAQDFDGDGRVDLKIDLSSPNTQQLILHNDGNNTFTSRPLAVGGAAWANSGADFNGDGRLDLLGFEVDGNTQDLSLVVWRRNGANTGYEAPETTPGGTLYNGFMHQVGDLNQDGRPDVVVLTSVSAQPAAAFRVSVWLRNAGNTGFGAPATYTVANAAPGNFAYNGPSGLELADADGDGALDIVVGAVSRISVLRNDGTGTAFAAAANYNSSNGVVHVVAGDFNGDGRTDFLSYNIYPFGTNDASVFLNTGSAGSGNNAPTLNTPADLTIDEDSGPYTVPLSGISNGGDAGQAVTITAVSSDPSILPNPAVSYTSPTSTGALRLQPAPNAFGTVTVTVTASDGQAQNGSLSRSFLVTINPVNDLPTLDPIPDVVVTQLGQGTTVQLSGIGAGAANENQTLTVTPAVTFASGSGPTPSFTLRYATPATTGRLDLIVHTQTPGLYSTNTVTVSDGQGGTVTRSFRVFYQQSGGAIAAPTLDPIADRVADRSLPTQPVVTLTGIDDGDPVQTLPLTVTAVSSDPTLVSVAAVGYNSPAATGTLHYSISPTLGGVATITVTVSNGQTQNGSITRSFQVTVPHPTAAATAAALPALRLYPNPSTNGRFTLETEAQAGPATVAVSDVLGREVYRQELKAMPARLAVQLPGAARGVYVVRLRSPRGTVSRRLVVE